jgi:hypothetical protein
VGDRCPEERHDGVADELVDGTLVAIDLGHETTQALGRELADLLDIQSLGQAREADQVGEEDRDRPSLLITGRTKRR